MSHPSDSASLGEPAYPVARGGIPDSRFCAHWWRGNQCRLAPEHAGAHDYSRPPKETTKAPIVAPEPSEGRVGRKLWVCPICKKVLKSQKGYDWHRRQAWCVKF
jgi:uncharacterized C2H2 Zn-finger protein